jgi:putative SOS response-associated peptidase YedK
MCGRYYRRSDQQKIAEAFKLGQLPDGFVLSPDYNVAPTTFQSVIRNEKETGDRELVMMRWGLVPNFAKSSRCLQGNLNDQRQGGDFAVLRNMASSLSETALSCSR